MTFFTYEGIIFLFIQIFFLFCSKNGFITGEKFQNILEENIMFSIYCVVYIRDLFLNIFFYIYNHNLIFDLKKK